MFAIDGVKEVIFQSLLESSPAEENVGVLADGKPNMSQQCVFAAWKAGDIQGCKRKGCTEQG